MGSPDTNMSAPSPETLEEKMGKLSPEEISRIITLTEELRGLEGYLTQDQKDRRDVLEKELEALPNPLDIFDSGEAVLVNKEDKQDGTDMEITLSLMKNGTIIKLWVERGEDSSIDGQNNFEIINKQEAINYLKDMPEYLKGRCLEYNNPKTNAEFAREMLSKLEA